jgi:hypothetical protein
VLMQMCTLLQNRMGQRLRNARTASSGNLPCQLLLQA